MNRPTRLFPRVLSFLILLSWGVYFAEPCQAASPHVVSVEEHWELKISQPEIDRSAPQTTMLMSPTNNLDGVHFLFTLNHSTVPDYAAGGVQVQVWDGEELLDSESAHDGVTLEHNDETITWVQRTSIQDGQLSFQVLNGQSQSWGTFGGDSLSVSVPTSLNRLNGYRPAISLSESQVGYAENRVVSLVLTKIVWVTEDGEVPEQSAPMPVDASLDE
jgi:hypothetical protein